MARRTLWHLISQGPDLMVRLESLGRLYHLHTVSGDNGKSVEGIGDGLADVESGRHACERGESFDLEACLLWKGSWRVCTWVAERVSDA